MLFATHSILKIKLVNLLFLYPGNLNVIILYLSLTVGVLITTHPQDELVNVSDNVNFTCEASGSLPISYRWLYNGNYIMNDPGHIEGVNTTTLMIINVITDWGMYSCEASNIVNNVTSNEATLYGEDV